MNINTKQPIGAVIISGLIIASFSIGVSAGKKKDAPVPINEVTPSGHAAKMVGQPWFVELPDSFHPSMQDKKKIVRKFNADERNGIQWELVEVFYRRVK